MLFSDFVFIVLIRQSVVLNSWTLWHFSFASGRVFCVKKSFLCLTNTIITRVDLWGSTFCCMLPNSKERVDINLLNKYEVPNAFLYMFR